MKDYSEILTVENLVNAFVGAAEKRATKDIRGSNKPCFDTIQLDAVFHEMGLSHLNQKDIDAFTAFLERLYKSNRSNIRLFSGPPALIEKKCKDGIWRGVRDLMTFKILGTGRKYIEIKDRERLIEQNRDNGGNDAAKR